MANFVIAINSLFNQPVALMVLLAIWWALFAKKNNLSLPEIIASLNSISSQPFALMVLVIGFWMLVECKKRGIDTTIAGGVIGVASNMLQSQIKDLQHQTPLPGSVVSTSQQTKIETPPVVGQATDPNAPVVQK